ncbi:TonB-linked SusC/RagA family outer membrane protein [Pedobacter africanus]|uniref:TonB-linked SusC/RagA family outer membrane protein n=1 Tax=Pedobacter africanus TaxID=151894 RepID=A0ACC6L387_9SPHI|nr:SusC/RagA family TonB-linked outer membrane protein [Pedobacter africanus]MDR6786115.1 TonB-linked SusC/RagA family outer membrane protein [Pedobacter africanus]
MRIFRLLMVCLLLHVKLYAQQTKSITISVKDVSIETVLSQVKKQTGVSFFYKKEVLKAVGKITIDAKNVTLKTVLDHCFQDTPLGYTIVGNIVTIGIKNERKSEKERKDNFSQHTVQGIVFGPRGERLSGANVIIKRSHLGTSTNTKGEFTLKNVYSNDTLSISYIGYTRLEVPVAMQTEFNISMKVAENALDAVMVQAYGTTTKRMSVGEITQISGAELAKQPVTNVLLALQGKVPGMLVTPTSGVSGAPVRIEIRGRNSIANVPSEPLYVIDGIPIVIPEFKGSGSRNTYESGSAGVIQTGLPYSAGQSPLFGLNMQDIESVSILSDAAATARYGARAGNGVILITTKKGKAGAAQFNINVDRSVNKVIGHWDMLNTSQYLQMRREALQNDGVSLATAPDLVLWDTTRNVDWQKELWKANSSTKVSTSLSGGSNLTTFSLSANYEAIQDVSALSDQNKNQTASVGLSLSHSSLNQKLTISVNGRYTYTNTNEVSIGGTPNMAPNLPPIFDEKGNLNYGAFRYPGAQGSFPFAGLFQPGNANTYSLSGGMNIGYKPIKGLDIGLALGYGYLSAKNKYFFTIASYDPIDSPLGTAYFGNNGNISYNVNPMLTYSRYIGKGNFRISLAGTLNNATADGTTLIGSGYKGDELLKSINHAPNKMITEYYAQNKYIDVNGSVNYNWESKYVIEFNGNRSGSSSFGPGRRFGNFWSAGANWFPLEEKWLKGVAPKWLSLIKFSGNYGIIGKSGGDYQYLSQWSSGPPHMPYYSYNGNLPLIPLNPVNQDYRWQTVTKRSASLTLGFLEDRFNLELTAYKDNCDNQLTALPTPMFTGFLTVQGNSAANVQNTGITANLNTNIINTKNFSWSASFNISRNRNKLLSYPGIEYTGDYTNLEIGKSLNTSYLLHYLGVDPQTGVRVYEDYNNDGKIGFGPRSSPGSGMDDRYLEFDRSPKFNGGANTSLRYKNLSLDLMFSFQKMIATRAYTGTPGAFMQNVPVSALDNYWKKPGDIAVYPRLTENIVDSNFILSDGSITDASFLRLNTIAIAYSLSEGFARKLGIKGLSFGLNIQNIFTLTKYEGIDPQLPFGSFPQPRTFNGRLAITL